MHLPIIPLLLLLNSCRARATRSSGCERSLANGITKGQTGHSNSLTIKTSSGIERSYLPHIPESYDIDTPTGLIWSYHGRGKNAEHQEKITKFSDDTSTSGYIVVYPQGTPKSTGKSSKNGRRQESDGEDDEEEDDDGVDNGGEGDIETSASGSKKLEGAWQGDPDVQADDVQFTLELLDNITKIFCIEEDKVYASGISNGGGFVANVLACDATASKRFAAFASASGAYYQNGMKDNCEPETVAITCNNDGNKTPLIVAAGGKDRTIPTGGGDRRKSCLPSVEHFVTEAARRNGLDANSSHSKVDDSDVTLYTFGQNASLGMVQYYYIPEMGHTWPTGDGKTHISATKVFLDFFEDWNLTSRAAAASSSASSGSVSSEAASTLRSMGSYVLGIVVAVYPALHLV